jgi:hypothetical protein
MKKISLKIVQNGEVIFQSDKRWLFPLFDLEEYLTVHPIDMSKAEVHDKVIGKAAALLIIRLGAGSVHGDVMSKLAHLVFDQASIPHTFNTFVERIDCQTEEILLEINDPDTAYQILYERANRY